MLLFDEQGLLTPVEGIPASVAELYDELVQSFPDSKTRESLFQNWMRYTNLLRQEVGVDLMQWVDGSFVTQKLSPNDLDVVSFIPSYIFRKFEKRLDFYWTDNWEREGIDGYLVVLRQPDEPDYYKTVNDINDWRQRYTRTKPRIGLNRRSKGYLIITVL